MDGPDPALLSQPPSKRPSASRLAQDGGDVVAVRFRVRVDLAISFDDLL
jgi:hypothetical protein